MELDPFWVDPSHPSRHGNREVHSWWIHIGDSVQQQRCLMRQGHALGPVARPRPQDSLTVLGKPLCRILCNPVDPSAHSFQSAALPQSDQDGVLNAQRASFLGRKQAVLLFSKSKQLVHAGTGHELSIGREARGVNIIPLWNYIDNIIHCKIESPYTRHGSMINTVSASAPPNKTLFKELRAFVQTLCLVTPHQSSFCIIAKLARRSTMRLYSGD